jgi:hypothetical protein
VALAVTDSGTVFFADGVLVRKLYANCSAQDCGVNGICQSFNACLCEGWLQPDCVTANCTAYSECNVNGNCTGKSQFVLIFVLVLYLI